MIPSDSRGSEQHKETHILLLRTLTYLCAAVLEIPAQEIDPDEPITTYGIDSISAAMLHDIIEMRLIKDGYELPLNDFLAIPNLSALSAFLITNDMIQTERLTEDIDDFFPSPPEPAETPAGKTTAFTPASVHGHDAPSFRFREIGFSTPGHRTSLNGKALINFSSNDYLSLANDPGMIKAATRAMQTYGLSCGSSMLGTGSLAIHEALSEELADFIGKESVMLMPAGYMAMLGFCATTIVLGQTLFSDAANHRSIIDGLRLGKGASERKGAVHFFNHNSLASLRQIRSILSGRDDNTRKDLLIIEGVYSMDGDQGDLTAFVPYCTSENMQIAIDDAHGLGVLGDHGRGTANAQGKTGEIDFILGSFSKAMGAGGGFIAGNRDTVDALKQNCSQYMFSASLTPAVVESVRYAIRLLRTDNSLQMKLWENIRYCRKCLSDLGCDTGNSDSAVIPLYIRDSNAAIACSRKLSDEKGIFVLPVIYPAVKKGWERMRITINAGHSKSDIQYLAESLETVLQSLKIPYGN